MVTIIDRTLINYHDLSIFPHDLIRFCELLFKSGVTKIELPCQLALLLRQSDRLNQHLVLDSGSFYFLLRDNQGSWQLEANPYTEIMVPSAESLKNLLIFPPLWQQSGRLRLTGFPDLLCDDYDLIFKTLTAISPRHLNLCPSNQNHCATAISLEWLLTGGLEISCAFAEHHDFAPLEEVLMGLNLNLPAVFNGDLSVLWELRSLYEKIANRSVSKIKPVIGEDIFKVESGIHVDGVLKNPQTYEPFRPDAVGNQREIVLGKHSGSQSVLYKLKGQNLSETVVHSILKQIKERCAQLGRNLSDLELCALAREVQNEHGAKIYC